MESTVTIHLHIRKCENHTVYLNLTLARIYKASQENMNMKSYFLVKLHIKIKIFTYSIITHICFESGLVTIDK